MSKNDKPPADAGTDRTGADADDCLEGLKGLAREIVYRTPEVRPDKVASVKEAVEQGTYEVDAEKLAEIVTEELLGKR